MMSAKVVTLGFLRINVPWNKGYDAMIFVRDVTNKILSLYSNYIVDVPYDQNLVTLAFLRPNLS